MLSRGNIYSYRANSRPRHAGTTYLVQEPSPAPTTSLLSRRVLCARYSDVSSTTSSSAYGDSSCAPASPVDPLNRLTASIAPTAPNLSAPLIASLVSFPNIADPPLRGPSPSPPSPSLSSSSSHSASSSSLSSSSPRNHLHSSSPLLIAENEVGKNPERLNGPPSRFASFNSANARRLVPLSFSTSSYDTDLCIADFFKETDAIPVIGWGTDIERTSEAVGGEIFAGIADLGRDEEPFLSGGGEYSAN
ncbi:hypothetical protein AGABI2DRAFT_114359 [Agaricus bisporus var. bisporus H97]|uniref:hypothetical protein n=1 Tax=Agaricus bisporus var. bisporus (strain H97 / ATCC MYA-4626 / FGSC 10389) TaxID=936046 RepID=UPI00029F774E|nr:hypothetical protein AGABI2DRAFT_114359 [Agaricus bisporus var. bisporus H97]EKV51639.1 hypothetical protein AGABI2DRAFT_114359 [Agaricus bisporus var. bisporus H97]